MIRLFSALIVCLLVTPPLAAADYPRHWDFQWGNTDFSKSLIDFREVRSGGPPKDGIPSIDDPTFIPVSDETGLSETEPVIGLIIEGDARAYPLRILMWHEIVNDMVGGLPVTVTYCPLCNSSIVFDRRYHGKLLDFGTTGMLRKSDLVMYDRQTESWWQQFTGEAIVGALTGETLTMIPSRLESWASFKARAPEGQVLIPNDPSFRNYGRNPYAGYDTLDRPFLYSGEMPDGIEAMARVVAVGDQAWPMQRVRDAGRIEHDDLVITWESGQASALDSAQIREGRDVGNVIVQRHSENGLVDAVHDITFAFVFNAFRPDGTLYLQ